MLVIIDYGIGNLGSIRNMLKKIGVESLISSDRSDIQKAKKLILPGVGSFDHGMSKLVEAGFVDVLNEKVIHQKTPILGICLGVQLFTKKSEEGKLNGLGWFDAETVKFDLGKDAGNKKIPHMGWNDVTCDPYSRLFKGMYPDPRFYFVHSYHLKAADTKEVCCKSVYAYEFAAGLEKENIVGVQFHPEKSHKFGMKVLNNFCELY